MKRKPLNKSRLNYLKQNTPLNVVPEKKLKRAYLAGLIENRGKSRFRTKRLRERVESLISIDLVFKNKTNAKPHPDSLVRTTFAPQTRNTLKSKYPFHLDINAKRTLHVSAAIPKQQVPWYGSWCQGTHPLHTNARYIVATAFSKFHSNTFKLGLGSNKIPKSNLHEQKKIPFAQKVHIGTKYIVKRTALGSTKSFSNTRFKVHSQDLKQLIEGRGRKVSPYKARLLERKKLSLIYGNLGWREIRKCVLQSKHKKGVASPKSGNKKTRPQTTSFPENLITLLESRVDVVLYRCRFFPSFSSCKQAINHGKIFVNHRQVRIAGHLLKGGDVIQFLPQSKQSLLVQKGDLTGTTSLESGSGIAKAESATFSERDSKPLSNCRDTLVPTFGNQESSRAAIESKTYLPCPDSARKEQQGKPCGGKKANYLLSLENEKQKTLLYFQNKIKSRPFSPSLPSTLLTRFKPFEHFPLHANLKPNQLNIQPLGCGTGQVYNKQDYGSPFSKPFRLDLGTKFVSLPSTLKGFNRTWYGSPFSLLLENVGKRLFRDLKERKRILQNLSSQCNERLDGDGRQVNFKTFNTDRFTSGSPLRNRDNPSLFLRSQSRIWVESFKSSNNQHIAGTGTSGRESFKEHKYSKLATQGTTGLRGLARTGAGKEGVNRLKRLSPPFYRAVKPLNLEVSYQTLTAIFLFPPQKVYFPAHIDLEMIGKSI